MLIHFVRNGTANTDELQAYAAYVQSRGHQALVHDSSQSVPSSASVVWWMCGRVSHTESWRLRLAFQVHEYTSAASPPHAWLKDQVTHWTQPKPDYRIYQNGWLRERLGFGTAVPHALRDLGVPQHYLDTATRTDLPAPDMDLVYAGDMAQLHAFVPMLHSIHASGRRLLLIGDVPEDLQVQLPESVVCTGHVSSHDMPLQLRRARYGLNVASESAHQLSSAAVLAYCAVGLPVVSHDYPWVRYFAAHHQANFLLLGDDPLGWEKNFGEAMAVFPYRVPDVRALAWPLVLDKLGLWKHVLGC
jgi:glycosyltransferase involved in cell wall biosynthesis